MCRACRGVIGKRLSDAERKFSWEMLRGDKSVWSLCGGGHSRKDVGDVAHIRNMGESEQGFALCLAGGATVVMRHEIGEQEINCAGKLLGDGYVALKQLLEIHMCLFLKRSKSLFEGRRCRILLCG
jgi:hypothetical protein